MKSFTGGSGCAWRRRPVVTFAAVLGAACALAFFHSVQALYIPPPETFITDRNEQKVTVTIDSGSLADAQAEIDRTRNLNPEAVIVVQLSGTYEVGDAPLSLPAKSSLVLSGTLRAAPGATATALISIDGQSRVSVAGGTLDGAGQPLSGIRVVNSSKVNIDGVTVSNTGQAGISFTGPGATTWDGGSTITRSVVSRSAAAGIHVLAATRVVILDSYLHDNAGPGIHLGASANHGSVVNNRCDRNPVGIQVDGRDNAVSDNTLSANARGLVLGAESVHNSTLTNIIAHQTDVGIDLGGTTNLVFSNNLFSNARDFVSTGTTNYVVPDTRSLDDSTNRYFYPPTIGNPHDDPRIVNGKVRVDVSVGGTSLVNVQAEYDAAREAHPDAFIVLHMNGNFVHEGSSLRLSSYTALILDGRIDVLTGPGPVIKGVAGSQFLSISGGVLDGHNIALPGVQVDVGTMAFIDRVTVNNFGRETPRSGSNSIHLTHGTGFSIVRGCRVDVSGGRAIWTQHSSSRYIVVGNHTTNANMDGIDFDSHTANSLAKDNLAESNTRYGIFIEEGAQNNKTYNNTLIGNEIGVNFVSNATGPTRRNTTFGNRLIANEHGLRTLGSPARLTDENFMFNNVVKDQTVDSIRVQGAGPNNYFSNNILEGNTTIHATAVDPPVFFNSPSARVAPTMPEPIVTPTPTPTRTPDPNATPTPTPGPTRTPTPAPLIFEAENIPYVTSGPGVAVLNEAPATGGKLLQVLSPPMAVGDWIEFTLPGVPRGTYDLVFRYKTHPNRGIHDLSVDGAPLNGTLDQHKTGGSTYPEKNFGTIRVEEGDHRVRLSVVDKRPAAGSYSITADRFALVADRRAPVLSLPGDITVEATGPDGASVTFSGTATDDKDGDVSVSFEPASGTVFQLGTSTVEATATDFAGNKATATFKVTVADTTAPALQLPATVIREATGPDGAVATFSATAHDIVDGPLPVSFDIASGSTFPLGRTTVTASATDIAENTATGTFDVIVQDTTAPVLTLPSDRTIETNDPLGAVVDFTASAVDIVSGSLAVTLTPPAGSLFPVGVTTVTARAVDAAGNAATGTFTVTVRIAAWTSTGQTYGVGQVAVHQGVTWKCIQAHRSQSDWPPHVVPALWVKVPVDNRWDHPVPYALGEEVLHNGLKYRCRQAHTSQWGWTPPGTPALWVKVSR